MFRSYLAAALRNLARSRFYAGISIAGLAIGLCAALLSFLVIRNQLTFDRFIPGYERIYLAVSGLAATGRAPDYQTGTNHHLAQQLQLRFKEVEATTRVEDEDTQLRRGARRGTETVYWADPNFLDVIALPVFAGDLHAALRRPDGIVLPRSIAKKYFGRDDVLGATLEVGTHPMTVTAVIEDLPPHATQLQTGILASGLAAWSPLATLDNEPPDSRKFMVNVRTYMRLASGASLDPVSRGLPEVMRTLWPAKPAGLTATIDMVRIDQVHVFKGLNPSIAVLFAITAAVGLIILFVACVNFVNLATARAARRSMEVAIRKAAGASRGALIVQFLGESLLYVTLATLIAMALTELMLPAVNAFMSSGAVFDYWRDPSLLAWLAVMTLGLSLIAGIYPAFVLSAFRPAVALKGANAQGRSGNLTRQILVTLQFATLMMLMVAAAIMYQQRSFATHEALRVDTDQHLMLKTEGCNSAFKTELQRLPGVLGASCSGWAFLSNASFTLTRTLNDTEVSIGVTPVDAGLLELYGLKPVAGRFLSDARDTERYVSDPLSEAGARGVINESGLRTLGFSSPQAAIGKVIKLYGSTEIVGVVADFSVGSVEHAIAPTIYVGAPAMGIYIDVKLRGRQIPETLEAIDRLWARTPGGGEPLQRFFLNDYIQDLYLSVLRVAQWFGVMAIVAVALACLGLIGLSASTTERRTKEIGIRKAMGATRLEILRLMVWQFIKPVLWACVIAAPISAWLMNRWLEGYAYHTDLTPWPFVGAATLSLAIAVLTVSIHCYTVVRAKPVAALRYE